MQAPPPPPQFPGPPEALQHMQYSQAPPPQPSSQVHPLTCPPLLCPWPTDFHCTEAIFWHCYASLSNHSPRLIRAVDPVYGGAV